MNMQVAKNSVVTLDYHVTDPDGEVVDEGREPLVYLHGGYDDIFPKIEEALQGKKVGESVNVKLQPDEAFLKSIEEQIAIIGSAAEGFRQEVIAYLWALSRRGERITYKSYEPLKEAIEKKLTESVRELSRIITTARTRDEEQTSKYNAMVRNLLDNGYCESCVDVVLKYAANNLWKD